MSKDEDDEYLDIDIDRTVSMNVMPDKSKSEVLTELIEDFIYLCKEGIEAIYRRSKYLDIKRSLTAHQAENNDHLESSGEYDEYHHNESRLKMVDYIID